MIRGFQHVGVHFRRTYRGNDAFAYPGDDRGFPGAAHQPFNIGPDSDPCLYPQFDAVFGHSAYYRCLNHFGIDAHLYRFQYVSACQIDGAGPFKIQIDGRPVGRNQGVDDPVYVTACQVMSFQLIGIDF